jgi:hypothetical protein
MIENVSASIGSFSLMLGALLGAIERGLHEKIAGRLIPDWPALLSRCSNPDAYVYKPQPLTIFNLYTSSSTRPSFFNEVRI